MTAPRGALLDRALDRFKFRGATVGTFMEPEFCSHVQVFTDDGTSNPTYSFIGTRTLAAEYFGRHFADSAVGTRGLPDQEFGRSVASRYVEVSCTNRPARDLIRAKTCGWWLQYERLIMPVEQDAQLPAFVVFLDLQRKLRALPGPSTPDLPTRSKSGNKWGCSPAAAPPTR